VARYQKLKKNYYQYFVLCTFIVYSDLIDVITYTTSSSAIAGRSRCTVG